MDKNDEFDLDFDFEKEYGFDAADASDEDFDDIDLNLVNELLGDEEPAQADEPQEAFDEDDVSDDAEIDLNDPIFSTGVPEELTWEAPEVTPAFDEAEFDAHAIDESAFGAPVMDEPSLVQEDVPVRERPERRRPERAPEDAEHPKRRRRKKTKLQIFKEAYLPYLIMGVAGLLCLIFIIGAIGRGIDSKDLENEQLQNSESQANAEAEQAAKINAIKDQAVALAAGYDYEGAIELLKSVGDLTAYPELVTLNGEYSLQMTQLQEWKNPSDIPNLSFNVLIADPARAFKDATYGTKYNQNFVTISEFEKILEQLYTNGYVLVDLDDVVVATTASDGTVSYSAGVIKLPSGKKPFMMTETLVNYFAYMIDSDKDGKADKGGAGFASRLVLENGEIKAEMVDAEGNTLVGNYDLVPILEDFIASHPDFSYKGARAILGVTGHEGVFGYRINDGGDSVVAEAKALIAALREKGYKIACNTYENRDYSVDTAVAIKNDLQSWDAKTKPVIGDVDILIFAQGKDISEYSGYKFEALYSSGFRYFIGASTTPTAELTMQFFHQRRLMVTGSQMANSSSTFAKYFNSMSILDSSRGTVPN